MANTQTVKKGPQRDPQERRRQEQYWRQLLKEQARSGVTQTEFCRRRSIPPPRLSWWKRELEFRDGKRRKRTNSPKATGRGRESSSGLVAVRVSGERTSMTFELVLEGGRLLRIPQDFDRQALSDLLELLEDAC